MHPAKRRVLIVFGLLVICLVALICFALTRKAEPIVSAFLTKLYTVEDPASTSALYTEMDEKIQKKMGPPDANGVATLGINEDPFYAHYLNQYGSLCTREGMEKMYANRSFSTFEMVAMRKNWKFRAGSLVLDQQTPNQFGYQLDVTVTDVATGKEKTVPMYGSILLKRTLLGYKVQAIQMQSTKLINPQADLF